MWRGLSDEFAELYPDRSEGLIEEIENDLERLSGKSRELRAELENLLFDVSRLRTRCAVFKLENELETLSGMRSAIELMRKRFNHPDEALVDAMLEVCGVLKRRFAEDGGTDSISSCEKMRGALKHVKEGSPLPAGSEI